MMAKAGFSRFMAFLHIYKNQEGAPRKFCLVVADAGCRPFIRRRNDHTGDQRLIGG